MKNRNMPRYFLTIGDEHQVHRLRDCISDQIELAEYEAEEEVKKSRAQGDESTIVRVVEASSLLVVYATERKRQ